ncbi:hypothetical protein E1B28_003955 [Marasmius oreades]|uniref:Uncharacterized protein n=1 Tax=Marasmius oreades TaxID=181124 RepID=A0A9P7UXM1_9AGAR|nr:uncharacterized protein E1B28_003955 [Marasmius oreades]KAG7096526.1 hypothetical protein E1B28_003955 [Marasmius oreades]
MRCTWFAKANCVLNALAHSNSQNVSLRALSSFKRPSSGRTLFSNHYISLPKQPASVAYASTAVLVTSSQLPGHIQHHSTSYAEERLSRAMISRSACKAIRIAMEAGEVSSAWLVLHSVRNSQKSNDWGLKARTEQILHGFSFEEPISPRLCAHALLHGLLRLGLRQRAYRLSQQLIADGVRIHGKTLEAVVWGILDASDKPSGLNGELYIRWKALLPTRQILQLSPAVSINPSIRCAIQILQAAREHNQQRSERMFSAVIKACLLHGELLAASLVFTAIIKACTLKDSIPVCVSENTDVQSSIQSVEGLTHSKALLSLPNPHAGLMVSIVNSITEIISKDKHDNEDDTFHVAFQAALQALANLACLLDWRQLPFGEIACLLQALYSCPKVDNKVWVPSGHPNPQHVRAYDYFHRVLTRLTNHLPSHLNSGRSPPPIHLSKPRSERKSGRLPSAMPVLDKHSCNSLLHYTLRHRLSLTFAKGVMTYINKWHSPNVATLNILVTSGSLLRVPRLAENALKYLRLHHEDESRALDVPPAQSECFSLDPCHRGRFAEALRRLANERHDTLLESLSVSPQNADAFTLSAYITFLVSTGRAKLISELLFDLLPELNVVGHRPNRTTRPEVRQHREALREACLRRVAPYGPYFFVAFLNALRKAGQTGLAERVWLLAKEAERASWVEDIGGNKPWLLPVHAYTVMIQCYTQDALRRRRPTGIKKFQEPVRALLPSHKRRRTGHTAISVYNTFMKNARAVYRQLTKLHVHDNGVNISLQIPQPDARLFNAMLKIATRHPMMLRRRANTSPTHWEQHIRFTRWIYANLGNPRVYPDVYIEELIADMMEYGFPIPIGLQYLLVRHNPPSMYRYKPRWTPLDRGPYVYPRLPKTATPFTLPTGKTKGLPLRRRRPQRRFPTQL